MFLSLQELSGMSSLSPVSRQPVWELQFSAGRVRAAAPCRISFLLHHRGHTWLSPVPTALGDCGDTHLPLLGQPEVFGVLGVGEGVAKGKFWQRPGHGASWGAQTGNPL